MGDNISPKAISDLVLLSRCRAAEALGLNLSPSEVMTLAALAAERDRLDMLTRGQEEQLEIQGNELARRASRCNELGDRIRELEAQLAKADALTAAGFAEYERRLAALDVAADPRVAALVEALELFTWSYLHESDKIVDAFYRAESALAAIKGGADDRQTS